MKRIILASTSPYRRELLSRFGIPFEAASPLYDEGEEPGFSARDLALMHAEGKALSLEKFYPDSIIIGSDQTAELDGAILGKPGTLDRAVEQLGLMSGRRVVFHTGVAVLCDGVLDSACERFEVELRNLTPREIAGYVEREAPLDCAGSFKVEGLGIALMEKLCGDDFTSLVGLPLIRLRAMLARAGVDVLSPGAVRTSRSSCR